jgi:putative ABC transport system ATP-binding protein
MDAIIKLDHLEKTYQSAETPVRAVRSVSLEIERGDFVAIMGTSGSGKSTMMNILGCLDRPTGGTYLLDGVDVSHLSRNEFADVRNRKIGFVFQNFNLLARTSALDNVQLPMLYNHSGSKLSAKQQQDKAMKMLEMVGIGKRWDHTPSQLSGGQQQRVAIARSLINDPVLLLADEPTGNLDTRTSFDILGIFQRLNDQGITVIMVTHENDVANFAKRIIVMRDGKVRSDVKVPQRSFADIELKKLEAEKDDDDS